MMALLHVWKLAARPTDTLPLTTPVKGNHKAIADSFPVGNTYYLIELQSILHGTWDTRRQTMLSEKLKNFCGVEKTTNKKKIYGMG